nr:MAG TPA: hypothetical protein [Bacteriophage sp.]
MGKRSKLVWNVVLSYILWIKSLWVKGRSWFIL